MPYFDAAGNYCDLNPNTVHASVHADTLIDTNASPDSNFNWFLDGAHAVFTKRPGQVITTI